MRIEFTSDLQISLGILFIHIPNISSYLLTNRDILTKSNMLIK